MTYATKTKSTLSFYLLLLGLIGFQSCDNGWSTDTPASQYAEGIDAIYQRFETYPNFTVLLYDMNYENSAYLHKYQVLVPETDTVMTYNTNWVRVSKSYFNKHQGHLGMEVASKENGQVSETVAPPGYSQYVGNERYGQWENRSGTSFWVFYGRYAFLRSILGMNSYRPRYNSWNTYNTSYRGTRDYRGSASAYGTSAYVNSDRGKNTSWARQPASTKNDILRQAKTPSNRNSGSSARSSRTGRSSGRYTSSGSSRSRGGGGGK